MKSFKEYLNEAKSWAYDEGYEEGKADSKIKVMQSMTNPFETAQEDGDFSDKEFSDYVKGYQDALGEKGLVLKTKGSKAWLEKK